jgi:hypothetical protein
VENFLFPKDISLPLTLEVLIFLPYFDEIVVTPVTNVKLEKMLTEYKRRKPESTDPKPIPMKIKVAGVDAAKKYILKKRPVCIQKIIFKRLLKNLRLSLLR